MLGREEKERERKEREWETRGEVEREGLKEEPTNLGSDSSISWGHEDSS